MVKQSATRERHTTAAAAEELKFKGVRKRKWGKWVSEIRLPNSRDRIWLGSYDSAEKAARAFDAALFCLRGPTAKFNFPDNPPAGHNFPGAASLSRDQIQEAAVRFANSGLGSESRAESPCPSSSDVESVHQVEPELSELALDESFLDQLTNISDYGIFPGFDDLCNEYFAQTGTSFNYYEEDQTTEDQVVGQDSFLWNF
ncbi:Ethylene-responsive transcription factor ERF017 [Linum grandiflorum]